MDEMEPMFTQSQLEAIAAALGHTEEGLKGPEIGMLLPLARMTDPGAITKRNRIYNAFVESQNSRSDRRAVLKFIRVAMKPERYLRDTERFEPLRTNLNRALLFSGLFVTASGEIETVKAAETLGDAFRRANELREDLLSREVHEDILKFCRAELIADDYFHVVLEAMKSIASKLQARTGLIDDGAVLVDRALGGTPPMLAINALATESEKGEQRGFANLVKGTFGMFRNPTAHTARIHWPIGKKDAEDLLTLASMIHRKIDASTMPSRL